MGRGVMRDAPSPSWFVLYNDLLLWVQIVNLRTSMHTGRSTRRRKKFRAL